MVLESRGISINTSLVIKDEQSLRWQGTHVSSLEGLKKSLGAGVGAFSRLLDFYQRLNLTGIPTIIMSQNYGRVAQLDDDKDRKVGLADAIHALKVVSGE